MLATGCRDNRGRDAWEKTIVVLALWVLVELPILLITRDWWAAVINVLPSTNIGERKVIRRKSDNRPVSLMKNVCIKGGLAFEDVTAIGNGGHAVKERARDVAEWVEEKVVE